MRRTIFSLSVLLAPAFAGNCNRGLSYCGTGLLDRGYDQQRLVDALERAGQAGSSDVINKSVYHCDNDSGDISFVTTCDNCKDGGAGQSDTCDTGERSNCDGRFTYCGSGILNRKGYAPQVESALRAAGQPTTDEFMKSSLFKCKGDGSGTLEYLTYCGKCNDGGSGNSDHCARDKDYNCAAGFAYCGFNLMNKSGGKYYDRISSALQGVFPDGTQRDRNLAKTLFMCSNGGGLTALSTCNCLDGGSGKLDYCGSQSCKKGVTYCGKRLLKDRRARRSTLADALAAAGQPTDNTHVENSVFTCEVDTQDNKVKFLSFCGSNDGQCQDGGDAGDHCEAKFCRIGIDYCGKTLLGKDPSYSSIIGNGQLNSLYRCNGAANGGVEFIRDCSQDGSCIDGGDKSDYCKR
ncbi:hypothetical protein NLG97_g5717 [Lecanicillium saksenae]|uniref:Uncharacterized protein n=1 Tax=Lecanicillium saksenae TaxID=468837 RepID=A0ACC1QRM4_9HYPO|nr:hypothetical protein NLG97_g5717 [Lecanicillium saksenae]